MLRILTAAVLVPILLLVIKFAPPWGFTVLFGLGIGCGILECYVLERKRGSRPLVFPGLIATLAIVWAFSGLDPAFSPILPLSAAAVLVPIASMWARGTTKEMLDSTTSTLYPVVLVGLTLAHAVAIRALPGERGEDLLILLLLCVSFSDTAAFYTGVNFGKRRMAPGVSPKKSWEGAIGGLTASVGGGLMAHFWFYRDLPLGHAVVLGVLLGAAGILGDLTESMLKRAAGAKDASMLLPGHGGFMDRMDSLIFAAPLLFYYHHYFLS